MFTSSLAPLCPSLPSGLSSFFLSIFLPCIEFEFIHEPDKTRSLAASWYASIMDIDEERGEERQTLKRKKEEERVKRVRGKEAAAEEERRGGGEGLKKRAEGDQLRFPLIFVQLRPHRINTRASKKR